MKYIKGLDTLRAFAVTLVIIEHWWIPFDIDQTGVFFYWFKGLVPSGGFGVHLFFVLSGFLITSILLKAKNNGQSKKTILKNFFIRRSLRIFPIYYLTIFGLVLLDYPFLSENILYFVFYISNIQIYLTQSFNPLSHTWSLSVEEQFYLFWPWVILFTKSKYMQPVLFLLVFISLFFTIYIVKIEQNWAGIVLMPSCIQAFGIGGIYSYLKMNKLLIKVRISYKIIFIICLVTYFFFAFNSAFLNKYNYLNLFINSILSVGLIHFIITNKSNTIRRVLENKILNKIGQISYGIYLFHYIVPFLYEKLINNIISPDNQETLSYFLEWKNAYPFKMAMLIFMALISFNFIEKPILRLKKYFKY